VKMFLRVYNPPLFIPALQANENIA